MKKSMIRTGCIVCVMALVVSAQPLAVYAGPLGGAAAAGAEMVQCISETALAAVEITPEEIDAFFDNTVFVGDSVMEDFRNYSFARSDTWLGRLQFLAAVSFSTYSALRPVTSKSLCRGETACRGLHRDDGR